MELTDKEVTIIESVLDERSTNNPQDSDTAKLWWKFFQLMTRCKCKSPDLPIGFTKMTPPHKCQKCNRPIFGHPPTIKITEP